MEIIESGINTIELDENNIVLSINERELWSLKIHITEEYKDAMTCFIDNVLNDIMMGQYSTFEQTVEEAIKPQWEIWDMDNEFENIVYEWDSKRLKIGSGYKPCETYSEMNVISPIITIKIK